MFSGDAEPQLQALRPKNAPDPDFTDIPANLPPLPASEPSGTITISSLLMDCADRSECAAGPRGTAVICSNSDIRYRHQPITTNY
jgi:hypothetical protein